MTQKQSQFKQQILEEVTTGNIAQKSNIYFLVHRIILWMIAVVIIILGTCSFAVLFAAMSDLRGTIVLLDRSDISEVILLLPYIWIIFGAMFVWYAYRSVRHTEHGYRYSMIVIGVVILTISIIGGGALYLVGFAQQADHYLARHVPLYDQVGNPQHRMWRSPEEGLLAGKVIKVTTSSMYIADITGTIWEVKRNTTTSPDVGNIVRIIGTRASTSSIEAHAVFRGHTPLPPIEKMNEIRNMRKRMLEPVPATY